jgi:hypothetical protein
MDGYQFKSQRQAIVAEKVAKAQGYFSAHDKKADESSTAVCGSYPMTKGVHRAEFYSDYDLCRIGFCRSGYDPSNGGAASSLEAGWAIEYGYRLS